MSFEVHRSQQEEMSSSSATQQVMAPGMFGTNIQKLNGKNFVSWKRQILIVLELRGLIGAIRDEVVDRIMDMKASFIMMEAMDDSHRIQVQAEETARAMLICLERQYASTSANNLHRLLSQYFSLKKEPNDTINQHVGKVKELRNRLAELGEVQSENIFQVAIINSLSSEYSDVRYTWISTPPSLKNTDFLLSILVEKEEQLKQVVSDDSVFALRRNQRRMTPKEIEERKKTTSCANCGLKGHWWKECPSPSKNQGHSGFKSGSRDLIAPSDQNSLNVVRNEVNFHVKTKKFDLVHQWICDSGASSHMCNNAKWFDRVDLFNKPQQCSAGDGYPMRVLGKGNVRLIAQVDGGLVPITLKDVLCVPELSTNIISVGAADSQGIETRFSSGSVSLLSKNKVVMQGGKIAERLYLMHVEVRKQEEFAAMLVRGPKTFQEYHKVLGHASPRRIKTLLKQLEIKLEPDESFECPDCPPGKGNRVSHPSVEMKAQEAGVIWADLACVLNKPSFEGYSYYLVCKDEFTEFTFTYMCRSKSEVNEALAQLIVDFETVSGKLIKELHTDGGSEFVNRSTKLMLLKERINHTISAPYCPQQNGRAEREIQTITKSARTMLVSSKLPSELWPHAIKSAVHIKNRLPTTRSDITPFERLVGRKPTIDHLVEFGRPVHVIKNGEYLRKLDPRSEEGNVVGFTQRRNTYAVYIPAKGKIINTCDIIWAPHRELNEKRDKEEEVSQLQEIVVEQERPEKQTPERPVTSTPYVTVQENLSPNTSTPLRIGKNGRPYISSARLADFFAEIANQTSSNASQDIETPNDDPNNTAALTSDGNDDDTPPTPPPRSTSLFLAESVTTIPNTFIEATTGTNSQEWKRAIESELDALVGNETWVVVDRPDTGTALSTKWVFNLKRDASGKIERYKARLVVRGFEQKYGIDYFDTYAPVAKIDSIRTLFALCAAKAWAYAQFDVSTAFLNGTVSERIFIEPPDGVQIRDDKCLQLKRSLYGLKQAPACWNSCFDKALGELDFVATVSDPCVYVSKADDTIVLIYVDDGIVFSHDSNRVNEVVERLSKRFAIKKLSGDHYLGMKVERTEEGIRLSQEQYVLDILRKFNMIECNVVSTPLVHVDQLKVSDQERPTMAPYREAIGCLQYIASRTRPDILFAANYLARFSKQPNESHWVAVKRVIKYLKGTIDFGLEFMRQGDKSLLTPVAFCDADWANDPETRLSTTGVIIKLAQGPIIFSSGKQASLAQSSTEAEYIAANEATKDIVWLSQFLGELRVKCNQPILHIDNQSTIKQIENGDTKRRSKHVDIKYHYIRQEFKRKTFRMKAVASKEQLADYLTKPVSGPQLRELLQASGVRGVKIVRLNYVLLALTTMLCAISVVDAIRFEQTDPMMWTETDTYVELGVSEFSIELTLLSACEVHLGDSWSSTYNINQLSYNVTKQQCMQKYEELVASAMEELMTCLPVRRVTREPITIAIAASAATAAVAGGGSTIWTYLSSDSSYNRLNRMDIRNIERDHDIEELKNQLKNTQTAVTQGKDLRADMIKTLGDHMVTIENNKGAIMHLSRLSAQSAWDSATLYFALQEDRRNIEALTDSCRKGRVNSGALYRITRIPYLTKVEEKNTYLEDIVKLTKQTILLKFRSRMLSSDTKVYRASPFPHWINTDSSPVFVDYNGPRYIVKNDTNECIKGIEPPTHVRVFDTCYEKDYVDPRLLKWDEVTDKSKVALLSQPRIYTSDTETTIYCLYHRIKIHNKLRHCPPFPFNLPVNVPFELPNLSHNVSFSSTRLKDRVVKISSLAMINKTDEDFEREITLMHKLKEKNENSIDSMKFGIEKNTLTIPMEPYVFLGVGCIVFLFIVCCFVVTRLRSEYSKVPTTPNQHTEQINIYATNTPPQPPLPLISDLIPASTYGSALPPLLPERNWKSQLDKTEYPDLARTGLPFINELLERTSGAYQQLQNIKSRDLEEARKTYDTPPLRSLYGSSERKS